MSSNRRKKTSPSRSAPTTSQSTQQPPRRQLLSTPKSQSHPPQQKQQLQPDHPWSVLRPTFCSEDVPPSTLPSLFSRDGHALFTTAAGELLLFGGHDHHSLLNDLYVVSTRDCSVTFLKTSGDVPSPRFKPAGVLVSNVLLIWGGSTKLDDQGIPHGADDSLYMLSLVSRVWARVVVNGPRPVGRHCTAVTMVGSKLFVFGGKNNKYLNDMWALDLDSLNSNPVWSSYEPTPGDEKPPSRSHHVLVTTGDRIILFGGTNSGKRFNDTWAFDISTGKWTELRCTGSIPSPRCNHTAAVVDDVMYVFGGRDVDRRYLDDLIGLNLSTQQWFMLPKIGPSPSGRWGHAMASNGTRAFVVGGKLAAGAQADETGLIHVLETKHIKNPKPNPNAVKPNEKTTQPALKSVPQQPQYPMPSSSDAYVARSTSFQNSTPENSELGRPASPQITRERNPSPNGKTRRVPEKDDNSVVELERQLSATLAAKTERDQHLAQLTEELALKSALLERAEANATKRAGPEPRELADRPLAQTSLVEHKDAELVKMQAKLDELVVSRDQHVRALEQAQSALQKATSRAADADEYETELVKVRAELEARKSELEAIRLRLTDAEIGWAKSKTEAETLHALNMAGLASSTDEDRITRRLLERMRTMEAEMASLRWSEKSFEAMETRNEG